MTRRAHPEDDFHKTVAQFLDHALPEDSWWTTIPAGGGGKVRGALMKAKGYRAGSPDIEIIWRGQAYFIELKVGRKTPSDNQRACHADLLTAGAYVVVSRRIEEVEGTLRGWGFPLRASTVTRRQGEAA